MEINLYQQMFKRKSIRKYELNSLSSDVLNDISTYMNSLIRMNDEIKTEMKIVSGSLVKNLLPIKAPHYIIVTSENKDGYLTNVGFMLQQMDLFLSSNCIGSCWVGMAKPTKEIAKEMEFEFVIAMAFGEATENLHRESILEFKRKPLDTLCDTSEFYEIIEAARLAPSATNSQPWYFQVSDGVIHCFCVKSNIIKALIYDKMNKIDMGIAICHLWLALKNSGRSVDFFEDKLVKDNQPKGYYYIASLKFK